MRFSVRYGVCFLAGLLVALMLSLGIGFPAASVAAAPSSFSAAIATPPAAVLSATEEATWRNLSHQEPNFYQ